MTVVAAPAAEEICYRGCCSAAFATWRRPIRARRSPSRRRVLGDLRRLPLPARAVPRTARLRPGRRRRLPAHRGGSAPPSGPTSVSMPRRSSCSSRDHRGWNSHAVWDFPPEALTTWPPSPTESGRSNESEMPCPSRSQRPAPPAVPRWSRSRSRSAPANAPCAAVGSAISGGGNVMAGSPTSTASSTSSADPRTLALGTVRERLRGLSAADRGAPDGSMGPA